MKKNPVVISLFDGISCARVALERMGYKPARYFASEIDKPAIAISRRNWPDIVDMGAIENISCDDDSIFYGEPGGFRTGVDLGENEVRVDLLIGGSPCQDLSIAKQGRKGLAGEKSKLFYHYLRVLRELEPKWWILENVASMKPDQRDIISKELGVQPVMIDAALVGAQSRKRLFWTNIPNITQPKDRGVYLKDILLDGETDDIKSLCITASYHKKNVQNFQKRDGQMIKVGNVGSDAQAQRVYSPEGKSVTLSALEGGQGGKTGLYLITKARGNNRGGLHRSKAPTLTSSSWEHNNHLQEGDVLRKLHPKECERLQGLPDDYTAGQSNTQRYKACGNAFNVDVIAHILSFIPKSHERN